MASAWQRLIRFRHTHNSKFLLRAFLWHRLYMCSSYYMPMLSGCSISWLLCLGLQVALLIMVTVTLVPIMQYQAPANIAVHLDNLILD